MLMTFTMRPKTPAYLLVQVVPIYISEIAPPAVRGRLVGMYELGWQVGGLVGFWVRSFDPSLKQKINTDVDQLRHQRDNGF